MFLEDILVFGGYSCVSDVDYLEGKEPAKF